MPDQVQTIRQRLLRIIGSMAGIPPEHLRPEKSLEDHGLDSLDRMELVMEVEDAFNIEITDADGERLQSLSLEEVISFVEARRAAATV